MVRQHPLGIWIGDDSSLDSLISLNVEMQKRMFWNEQGQKHIFLEVKKQQRCGYTLETVVLADK